MGTNKINISIKNKNNRIQDKAHKIILTINILIRCFVYWLVSTFRIIVISIDSIPPIIGHTTIICIPTSSLDKDWSTKNRYKIGDTKTIIKGNIKDIIILKSFFFKLLPPL